MRHNVMSWTASLFITECGYLKTAGIWIRDSFQFIFLLGLHVPIPFHDGWFWSYYELFFIVVLWEILYIANCDIFFQILKKSSVFRFNRPRLVSEQIFPYNREEKYFSLDRFTFFGFKLLIFWIIDSWYHIFGGLMGRSMGWAPNRNGESSSLQDQTCRAGGVVLQ